jgi:hypothetical protein
LADHTGGLGLQCDWYHLARWLCLHWEFGLRFHDYDGIDGLLWAGADTEGLGLGYAQVASCLVHDGQTALNVNRPLGADVHTKATALATLLIDLERRVGVFFSYGNIRIG